jgi:hypothetical protein
VRQDVFLVRRARRSMMDGVADHLTALLRTGRPRGVASVPLR